MEYLCQLHVPHGVKWILWRGYKDGHLYFVLDLTLKDKAEWSPNKFSSYLVKSILKMVMLVLVSIFMREGTFISPTIKSSWPLSFREEIWNILRQSFLTSGYFHTAKWLHYNFLPVVKKFCIFFSSCWAK